MIYFKNGELHDGGVRQGLDSPAFRFGVGVFETLLYNGEAVCRVRQHLERARRSLEHFGLHVEETDYAGAMEQVIASNGLTGANARINIFFPVEDEEGTVLPVVTAAAYHADPDTQYRLSFCSTPVQHPYFVHKSMNYMFHWMERRYARLQGYDDAILTQPGNVLLETTTAALLFGDRSHFCTSSSMDKLQSTALDAAMELLDIRTCTVRAHAVGTFRHAYVLNSLIGMRPVQSIQGTRFEPDEETCRKVTALICS